MNDAKKQSRLSRRLTQWTVAAVLAAAALAPSTAHADDDAGPPDARLTGFPTKVDLGTGSTAVSWIAVVLLGVLVMSPLFKDAKRTHLD